MVRTLLLSLLLSGCATAVLSDGMQPDGSYRIIASGTCFAGKSATEKCARGHAAELCPSGYETKSVISDSNGCHPRTQLIVKCN